MPRQISIKNSVVELASVGIFGAMVGAAICAYIADTGVSIAEYATLLSGFGGAVLGSAMSAFVALVLARQTSKETLQRDTNARVAQEHSLALRLMVKSSLILSDAIAIKKAIDESLSAANDARLTSRPLWVRVLPIVGSYQIYDVEAEELAPLIAAKNSDLMHVAVTLFMQHRNLVEIVKVYSDKRDRVKDIITNHIGVSAGIVTSGMTQEDVSRMVPVELELESLVGGIRSMLPGLIEMGEKVTFGIGPAMRKFYGTDDFSIFVPMATDKPAVSK